MLKLKDKKVLVTGGNGYLGSFLVKALQKEGSSVSILDSKKSGDKNEFAVDITDKDAVEKLILKIKPEIVFHLAAILNRNRDFQNHDKIMQVNYTGTMNLLRAMEDIPYQNFIFASSSEIYGNNDSPFMENMTPKPTSPYSMSKIFAETGIELFSDLYKKPYTIIRIFNFFGPDMPESFFIPELFNALKSGKTFRMTKGEQARDFLYVNDVVQALLLSAQNSKAVGKIFNVCSGKSTTMKELALSFKTELKSKSKIEFGALPYRENEIWNMTGSNSKIKKSLGFKVNYSVKQAIEELNK
jgi:nucleoside-diphosphate-sugar epimerase